MTPTAVDPDPWQSLLRRIAPAAVVFALLGAIVGFVWGSTQVDNHVATTRLAFIDSVDNSALDARRDRILAMTEDSTAALVAARPAVVMTDFVTPPGRTFIDVVVESTDTSGAVETSSDVAKLIIEVELEDAQRSIDDEIERLQTASNEIETTIEPLEASMLLYLEAEAAAEADRIGAGDDAAAVEIAVVAKRLASDEYWNEARRRNALIDHQNELLRDIIRLRTDRDTAGNLQLLREATLSENDQIDPRLSGTVGGALLGLALVTMGAFMARRPR